jgi:hypothetical protein
LGYDAVILKFGGGGFTATRNFYSILDDSP